jgi:hypothetical protein
MATVCIQYGPRVLYAAIILTRCDVQDPRTTLDDRPHPMVHGLVWQSIVDSPVLSSDQSAQLKPEGQTDQ